MHDCTKSCNECNHYISLISHPPTTIGVAIFTTIGLGAISTTIGFGAIFTTIEVEAISISLKMNGANKMSGILKQRTPKVSEAKNTRGTQKMSGASKTRETEKMSRAHKTCGHHYRLF